MKIKDIINARHGVIGTEVKIVVKPMGTKVEYYNSEISNHLRSEVAEMEVEEWFVCGARKNKCDFVIIVERNEEYEAEIKKAWEDFCRQ